MKEPQKPISPPDGGVLAQPGGSDEAHAKFAAFAEALETVTFPDQTSKDQLAMKVLQIRLIVGRNLRRFAKERKAATGGDKK